MFLYCACRGSWTHYCQFYETLVEECEEDCGEYETNWKAGKAALGLFVMAEIALVVDVVNGVVGLKRPRCCSLRPWLQMTSFLCSSAAVCMWLGFSKYQRASSTEVEPGMTLALASVLLTVALVLHTFMIKKTQDEFQTSEISCF